MSRDQGMYPRVLRRPSFLGEPGKMGGTQGIYITP